MTTERNAEVQRLRAFIDARKRSIETAEKHYDVLSAVAELCKLAAPLVSPDRFSSTWKDLYVELFYREIATFLLSFVAVHIEICFSEQDRKQAFDVFFDRNVVPSSRVIGALTATLSTIKAKDDATDETAGKDAEVSMMQCVRLLEKAIVAGGVEVAVTEMLVQEEKLAAGSVKNTTSLQVLVLQLSSLPDIIFNRRQRNTPAAFRPHQYFSLLCDGLLHSLLMQKTSASQSCTFQMFANKLVRIGQAQALVQSWLRSIETVSDTKMNRTLFQSLPVSCYEQILVQIANEKVPCFLSTQQALLHPKYQLLAQVPPAMCSNKQFQYVVTHKLLLQKPIDDFYFWRVLVDVLARCDSDSLQSPLAAVFDVVLARLPKVSEVRGGAAFMQQDWITKLCKGVQDHMSHSQELVRALGMRVGESLSHIIASEKPLDFGLESQDPLAIYGCPMLPEELEKRNMKLNFGTEETSREVLFTTDMTCSKENQCRQQHMRKHSVKPFTLDPDELVLSDDPDASERDSKFEFTSDNSDSDSNMSLKAYDLHDDEEDLTAKRPMYLKDLIASLLSDDDREKVEAALNEAETLLRRQPRDLNDKADEVVKALLRLEDKYSTPMFTKLRSQALATACALAPTQTLPYLSSQALEREQLLQSRIDALQAMTSAARELSERGGGYQRSQQPKTLLHESDLGTRTVQSLKTRRWGYRRDPLATPKQNAFAPHALEFFSPLLFGYVKYVRKHSAHSGTTSERSRSEVEQTLLAHLLHALASFVECSGNAPRTMAMAKCLLEFIWTERANTNAEVRRQVLFSLSRVLLVAPPALLWQEAGEILAEVAPWLRQIQKRDPDAGCREAAQLLSSFASMPGALLSSD
ncbi:unnamed protein product [Peronospora belbahrii]|uniref:Telomere length regulation protein conserved domain-containing protein n=1 Tax=Peronospora belbahrii TaxID=622444 RepID=A0AAU9LMX0_9STRA|nr:unnamed protein product [Peronospora belbahrii]